MKRKIWMGTLLLMMGCTHLPKHYVVKNRVIQTVLSFGPRAIYYVVIGLTIVDCSIKNMVYAFKYNLTKDKAEKIISETNKLRKQIDSNIYFYNGLTNDTCAETALQILRHFIPSLPKGKGLVGGYKVMIFAKAVTPYWLFEDFKKMRVQYKTYPTDNNLFTKSNPKKLEREIVITANRKDITIW